MIFALSHREIISGGEKFPPPGECFQKFLINDAADDYGGYEQS